LKIERSQLEIGLKREGNFAPQRSSYNVFVRPRTVVVGVGNPILSDDRVGLIVAEELERMLKKLPRGVPDWLRIDYAMRGGLEFVEKLLGFERAIIVDSIKTGALKPGSVHEFSIEDFKDTEHLTSYHAVNLATALKLGEALGATMPKEIRILAIEIVENQVISEKVNAEVLESAKALARKLARELAS